MAIWLPLQDTSGLDRDLSETFTARPPSAPLIPTPASIPSTTLNSLVPQQERRGKHARSNLQDFRDLEVTPADADVRVPAEEHEGDGLQKHRHVMDKIL